MVSVSWILKILLILLRRFSHLDKSVKLVQDLSEKIIEKFLTKLNGENFFVVEYTMEIRENSYRVFEFLLDYFSKVNSFNQEIFVKGFLIASEGEKDPRCIVVVFRIFNKILSQF